MDQHPYLEMLFDPQRMGFGAVSKQILAFLDYHSFVSFKRSCRLIYEYLVANPDLEKRQFYRKCQRDWRICQQDQDREKKIPLSGEATLVKFIDNDSALLCSVRNNIFKFDLESLEKVKEFKLHTEEVHP